MMCAIIGIICFFGGAFFGVGWMCLLSAGKQADESMDFGPMWPEVAERRKPRMTEQEKNNPNLVTPEMTNEPNTNFDGILNNAPPMAQPVPVPQVKPLDRVKESPPKKRRRELER